MSGCIKRSEKYCSPVIAGFGGNDFNLEFRLGLDCQPREISWVEINWK